MKKNDTFCWKFVRIGGLDQVTLQTADELTHLDELDPKLWAALSCPAAGLEFDERTLELLDTDHDGRIRIPKYGMQYAGPVRVWQTGIIGQSAG